MNNIVFFDNEARESLLPFTFTRPIADLRPGYLSIAEKWARETGYTYSFLSQEYLSTKFDTGQAAGSIYIAGNTLPDVFLISLLGNIDTGSGYIYKDEIILFKSDQTVKSIDDIKDKITWKEIEQPIAQLNNLHDFQTLLETEILRDIELLQLGKTDISASPKVKYTGNHPIWVGEDVTIGHCYIDTTAGPVSIGAYSEIMDGAMIKGPFILGEHSLVKMGAKIYKNVAVGDNCKIAGEIQSTIIFGNSNKGHEGYLGNSVLGEWCNLGADTNNSNLKNNYEEVKLWSYKKQGFIKTGHQFLGLFMGDHSKSAINTMFNTGTVVGVSANIFGSGFPRNFIPSFSWGGNQGISTYQVGKAIETAKKVYQRRGKDFDQEDEKIFLEIFESSKMNRNWDR